MNQPTDFPNVQKDGIKIVSRLGKGSFGSVWKVLCEKTNQHFALKAIHLPTVAVNSSTFTLKKIKREAKLLRGLEHVNVVNYVTHWFAGPNSSAYNENTDTKIICGDKDSSKVVAL